MAAMTFSVSADPVNSAWSGMLTLISLVPSTLAIADCTAGTHPPAQVIPVTFNETFWFSLMAELSVGAVTSVFSVEALGSQLGRVRTAKRAAAARLNGLSMAKLITKSAKLKLREWPSIRGGALHGFSNLSCRDRAE